LFATLIRTDRFPVILQSAGKINFLGGDGDRGIREVPLASLAVKYCGQSFVIELSFAFRLYANGMVHIRAARQPKRGCGRKRNGGEEVVH